MLPTKLRAREQYHYYRLHRIYGHSQYAYIAGMDVTAGIACCARAPSYRHHECSDVHTQCVQPISCITGSTVVLEKV